MHDQGVCVPWVAGDRASAPLPCFIFVRPNACAQVADEQGRELRQEMADLQGRHTELKRKLRSLTLAYRKVGWRMQCLPGGLQGCCAARMGGLAAAAGVGMRPCPWCAHSWALARHALSWCRQ